jgi:hypothetical protein
VDLTETAALWTPTFKVFNERDPARCREVR